MALPAKLRVTSENSPSNVAPSEMPLSHVSSADALVSATLRACAAPPTMKLETGSVWKVAAILRSELKSCAQAARPRIVKTASTNTKDVSVRSPSSLRVAVTSLAS